jgi:DMSO/TMAO reductase YedYZ molybdopterin-dependent catalytic subunit
MGADMRRIILERPVGIWEMVIKVLFIALILPIMAACVITQPTPTPAVSATPEAGATPAACILTPVIPPTVPAEIPGYTQLDPTTGLHMTGEVQDIDLKTYRLQVDGKVNHPLSLSYDDLRCMPKIEDSPVLICQGYFEDVANWAGVPLAYVLKLADVQEGASEIDLISADGYLTFVSLDVARAEGNFLAYEWEGQPLPKLHGFPVRAVFPSLNGNKWAKWLIRIEVK